MRCVRSARYFDGRSDYWDDVYERDDVYAATYRRRHVTTADWLDRADLSSGGLTLELGCGSGRLTAESSAQRRVIAVDTSMQMLQRARQRVGSDASFLRADAAHLPMGDGVADAVVALGVLPWVSDLREVVAEVGRIVRPGGLAIVSIDNRWRLGSILDPLRSPLTFWLRRFARRVLPPPKKPRPPVTMHSSADLKRALRVARLHIVDERWIGFGPFTPWGRRILSPRLTTLVDSRHQCRADSGKAVRRVAFQYLVLCVKAPADGSA